MNGIDEAIFHPLPGVAREEGHILTVNSADIPLKGLAYLLQAVAALNHRKVRLTIIGELKQGGESERLINELGLRERVTVTGRIPAHQFAQWYARAALVVIPSLYEGFGLPAAEAMACGVPVITTSGGALPEVVGDAGITVPPGDAEGLKKALLCLLDNQQLAYNLGEAGRKRVGRLFHWRQAAEKTVAIYQNIIDANH
jgi:glycosyltransferase involved in cell wall biosynthesis